MHGFTGGVYSVFKEDIHYISLGSVYKEGTRLGLYEESQLSLRVLAQSIRSEQIDILKRNDVDLPHRYPFKFRFDPLYEFSIEREHGPFTTSRLDKVEVDEFLECFNNAKY